MFVFVIMYWNDIDLIYVGIIVVIIVFQAGTSFQYQEGRSCFVLSNDKRKGVLW